MVWPRVSVSTKLAALLFAAIFFPTAATLAFIQIASANTVASQQNVLVDELRDELITEYRTGGPQELADAIEDRIVYSPYGGEIMALGDGHGRVLVGNVAAWPNAVTSGRSRVTLTRPDNGATTQALLDVETLPGGLQLLAGHVTESDLRLRVANERALLLALAIAGPLSLVLAYMLLRFIEHRAGRVSAVAEQFGGGDLAQRVPMDGSGDAFDRLAHALNAMLDRIESLVGELRLVTDALAHDLRSPLARLRSRIDQATREVGDEAALDSLADISREADRLMTILGTALQISRAEAGIGRDRLQDLDLRDLLLELQELYEPIAEDRGIALTCAAEPGLIASVHRELLSQALGNLVDNALNYASGASSIVLSATARDGQATLAVADDGPGIAEQDRAAALRRFGRLDPARSAPGSGLGLPLVEATARLHGGLFALEDNAPGLRAVLTLPLRSAAPQG
jgi:signal transduction histidine kinase